MEGFFAALNVETDRIDDAERASNRAGDRPLVMDICCDGLQPRIMAAGRRWMPGGHANGKPIVMQMADNAAPQKPSPAKDRYTQRHGTPQNQAIKTPARVPRTPPPNCCS